ncbi:hypothetical protein JCGZ_26454 [Jatropha curcas]|uniref:Retrotransposon gag domain-containing protein n=1 Tax=Jatropha curcas TaxID=180498 RepID=A0A067JL20_JATCU|nr:hypothetical protein JCGZ_26454 [Jatropha curcas]
MKSKGMDQYMDIDDGDDEELELKNIVPLTYKMPKVSKYDGMGLASLPSKEILKMFLMSLTGSAPTWYYNLEKKVGKDWNEGICL